MGNVSSAQKTIEQTENQVRYAGNNMARPPVGNLMKAPGLFNGGGKKKPAAKKTVKKAAKKPAAKKAPKKK